MSKRRLFSSKDLVAIITAVTGLIGTTLVAYFAFRSSTLGVTISATQAAANSQPTLIPLAFTNTAENISNAPNTTPSSISFQFGTGGSFSDPSGIGVCVGTPKEIADRINAISITFNSGQGGYCGWKISLKNYNLNLNKRISFWAKGEKGGEQFKVGILDKHTDFGNEPKVLKEASADWTQIIILIDEFTPHPDLSSLDNLSLSFENGSGKIYVDQLIFAP